MLEDEQMMLYSFEHDVDKEEYLAYIYTQYADPNNLISSSSQSSHHENPKSSTHPKLSLQAISKQVRDAADRDLASVG